MILLAALLLGGAFAADRSMEAAEAADDPHARRVMLVGMLSNDARAARYDAARRARDACADCAPDPMAERLMLGTELQIDAMTAAQCAASHARKATAAANDNERFIEALAMPEQRARLQAGHELLREVPGAPESFRPDDPQDAQAAVRALYYALMSAPTDLCRAHDRIEHGSGPTVVERGFPGTCRSDEGILVQAYAQLLLIDALAPQFPAECALDASVRERMTRARSHFPAIAAAMPPPPGPFDL